MLNGTCYSECPFNYIKSKDNGTTCEMRTYLLSETLIYYPFASAGIGVILLCLSSSVISQGKSLFISNSIALLSLVELAALLFQMYSSYIIKKEYLIISGASFLLVIV
jgi:hypothetical protein